MIGRDRAILIEAALFFPCPLPTFVVYVVIWDIGFDNKVSNS